MGYILEIEEETRNNQDFRRVLYTSHYSQLVLMSLKPQEEIGEEAHGGDQFIRCEAGEGEVELDGEKHPIKDGSAVVIPAGTKHNVTNTSDSEELKLYTIYSPPQHKDGTVHMTKKEADKGEEKDKFEGEVSE